MEKLDLRSGYETARQLAARGMKVLLGVRDERRGAVAEADPGRKGWTFNSYV